MPCATRECTFLLRNSPRVTFKDERKIVYTAGERSHVSVCLLSGALKQRDCFAVGSHTCSVEDVGEDADTECGLRSFLEFPSTRDVLQDPGMRGKLTYMDAVVHIGG